MTDLKGWLDEFKTEYRKIINTKFSEYKEFFPAFSGNIPYLRLEIWKIYHGDHLKDIELRVYEEEYSDKILEINELKLKDLDMIQDIGEKESAYLWNDGSYQVSFFHPIGVDNHGKEIIDTIYPIQTIFLQENFQDSSPSDLVFKDINSSILSKLRRNINNSLFNKCRNRLSLITEEDLGKIIEFLDKDWTKLNDKEKAHNFNKIFYYLGFETIPIELLLSNKKYNELNNISHPEIIVYDLNSNYILLIEELNELSKEYLYKVNIQAAIIKFFNKFFPKYNRIADYLIITNKQVSIDLDKYSFKDRLVHKNKFVTNLKNVFNPDLLEENTFGTDYRKKIKLCLNFVVDKRIKIST